MPPPPPHDGLSQTDPWTANYINEDHLAAFQQALSYSDTLPIEGDQSPFSPRTPPVPADSPCIGSTSLKAPTTPAAPAAPAQTWKYGADNGSLAGHQGMLERERVEKLTATSDFAPIHQRVSRRKTPRAASQGLTYHLIRWPLLFFIFFIIYCEFSAYVLTRQIVNLFEWLVAWRGYKAKLRRELRKAKTYDEWVVAAKKLDTHLGFDEWKEVEEDSYFDYILVRRVRRTLIRLRAAKDTRGLMDALAICVRSNFAGTESVKMYSETFFGTKKVVEAHINEVAACLDYVRTATDVTLEEKRAFFRAINKHYGSSALCLSGGASFGYYHFGVVKSFLEADLLPRVVTGTSAGGLVAALTCTRTNEELKALLVPELADKITACEDPFAVWFKRFRQTGARFDTVKWARQAMWFTRGSLTFKEAYERTGRALNISVVPSERHSPTILLNHLTAPNCLIWSAILASAAVPGILNPVVLMAKDRNGNVKPHNLGGSRFKDGSLREDIPLGSLHTQFNCNFSIVSQTNPHIHLFFFAPRGSVGRPVAHRKGKGWRGGFILSALESYIKLDLSKHFKVIRDLDLMPQILQSDWSGVFLQRFSGDLTLTPRSTVRDWFSILSDPDRQQLERMMLVGERVTWPAMRMVRNRMTIEASYGTPVVRAPMLTHHPSIRSQRAILRGRAEVRSALHNNHTSTDQATSLPAFEHDADAQNPSGVDQIPIESDADAGFSSRSRRAKTARGSSAPGAQASTPKDLLGADEEGKPGGARRRKPQQRRAKETAESLPARRHTESPEPVDPSTQAPPHEPQPQSPRRGYSVTLGGSFRHVRAPSLTSLSLASPFRAIRASLPQTQTQADSAAESNSGGGRGGSSPSVAQRGPRSQLSITRWFGGASESSSESEDDLDEIVRLQSSASGGSDAGDAGDQFRLDSAVESQFGSDAEGATTQASARDPRRESRKSEGTIPSPTEIDASALAAERLRAFGIRSGEDGMTPPEQDAGDAR